MVDVSTTHLSYLSNDRKELSKTLALAIAHITGCDANWLLTGEGEMFLQNDSRGHHLAPDEIEVVELWRRMDEGAKSYSLVTLRAQAAGKKRNSFRKKK